MSPKILLEKNKERENRVSEEKEKRRRKRKTMAALLVFFDLCFRGESYFGCNVIQKSSSDIYFCERFEPRSHFKSRLSLIVLVLHRNMIYSITP